ncbi:MarC family protein [Myxococcota bacterium]|nr:MarC family protein [Myxococcota bacterium]
MTMYLSFFLLAFSSFFSLINPLAVAPVFVGLTEGLDRTLKRQIAFKATLTAAITLVIFVVLGEVIFKFFGLSIHGFRIAGGVLFFGMGYDMLQAKDTAFKSTASETQAAMQKGPDVGITPLGIPMICGPGSISNAIIMTRDAHSNIQLVILIATILLILFLTYIILLAGDRLIAFFGETGLKVAKRIMGLIVMVIAVEFIIAGSKPILIEVIRQATRG